MTLISVDNKSLGEASVFIMPGNIPVVKNSHELIKVVKLEFVKK